MKYGKMKPISEDRAMKIRDKLHWHDIKQEIIKINDKYSCLQTTYRHFVVRRAKNLIQPPDPQLALDFDSK